MLDCVHLFMESTAVIQSLGDPVAIVRLMQRIPSVFHDSPVINESVPRTRCV